MKDVKKLFGTDGIRGIACEYITPELCYNVGKALAILAKEQKKQDILIGGDTRLSTDVWKASIIAGALAHGANVIDAGILPTPAVSHIMRYGYTFGIMVTASHNPPEYNGIKVFDSLGNKLSDEMVDKLEYILQNIDDYGLQPYDKLGRYKQDYTLKNLYVDAILKDLNIDLYNYKVAIDCSNGACSTVAEQVFRGLNVEFKIFNTDYDGLNINEKCGALHPEFVAKTVKMNNYDIGFAFDGDGDRIVCVLNDGRILDGDCIIYVLSLYLQKLNLLYGDTVVTTILSNYGLEHSLKKKGITMLRTAVGDKRVSIELQGKKLALGGEKAGHIIYTPFCKTGDAIYIAGLLMKLQKLCNTKIGDILDDLLIYPCTEYNVPVPANLKDKVLDTPIVKKAMDESLENIQDNGRIVLRPSGTENIVRVVVEGKDTNLNDKLAGVIRDSIEQAVKYLS